LNTSGSNLTSMFQIINNSIYVNASIDDSFNQSANLTLHGITFGGPLPIVDYNDDGTFENCTDCTEISYAGGTYIFNTTHFTEMRGYDATTSCGTISTSTTLEQMIISYLYLLVLITGMLLSKLVQEFIRVDQISVVTIGLMRLELIILTLKLMMTMMDSVIMPII